ncbi:conserved hypothetical protein [Pyrenophora tritici-repentis Pt-1C-BFP]|uniref:Uncharacterized protein n=1 Tax=Pyrenophora tritici-repentis (strain Pt-1C-BFP) TaxID=426418 RepID=B2W1Y2_PYRTR|nr:uncharacterized protein PTRG_03430 [Pyrenophora tritici-repentis Pt-1C-BFP]EDU46268.1 conserved hypothetical protein [Pyrenophora tritici-repentis Pt-1C-BFP]
MTNIMPITSFRFRDLPGETTTNTFHRIRKKIYRVLLCEFTRPAEKTANSLDIVNYMETNTLVEHGVETAILCRSKEIYREAYDVMVLTNCFVKITSVKGIPLPAALSGYQAPLVSANERAVNNFKGYTSTPRVEHYETVGCLDDLVKVWNAFKYLEAHATGLISKLKMSVTIAPNLANMRADPISPSFDDFFTKKTQQALLKPLTDNLYGFQGVQIKGHVDSGLAAALNIAHVQVGAMPGFAPELLGENALIMVIKSVRENYWMKDYKYTPSPEHLAKLQYRMAMFYRLQGDHLNARLALTYINGAYRLQIGDAVIWREREKIVAWVIAVGADEE